MEAHEAAYWGARGGAEIILMLASQYLSKLLTCRRCSALGAVTWQNGDGESPKIIAMHGEFHWETGRSSSGDAVIVCTGCDMIQQDVPNH